MGRIFRVFLILVFSLSSLMIGSQNALVLKVKDAKTKINKEDYGHFAEHLGRCIYGGIFVQESSNIPNTRGYRNDVVKALKEMGIPMLRWPGGCFAANYHWRDGIGNHADRVKIANVAQVINVLQSVILTKEEQMALTPTYFVFKMYSVHQDATMVPIDIIFDEIDVDGAKIQSINASASNIDGYINITICNLNISRNIKLSCILNGSEGKSAIGEIITSENMNDFNDFGKSEKVNIKEFKGFKLDKNSVVIDLPVKSVFIKVKV